MLPLLGLVFFIVGGGKYGRRRKKRSGRCERFRQDDG